VITGHSLSIDESSITGESKIVSTSFNIVRILKYSFIVMNFVFAGP
jgi:cation transport ATPase